jgi:hypothetical protein
MEEQTVSKYKAGQKFIIEIGHSTVDPTYGTKYFVKGFRNIAFNNYGLDWLERYDADAKANADYNSGYEKGLKDAWECAKKVAMYDVNIYAVFDTTILKNVWDMNPSEAISKLKEYEAKQNEIKVGDIVRYNEKDGIVTFIKENQMYVMWEDGSTGEFIDAKQRFEKTGRHYDIDSILEQLKGTDDE